MKKFLLFIVLSFLICPQIAQAQSQRNPCVYITSPNCLAVGYYLAGTTGAPMPVGGIANSAAPTFTEGKPGYLSFDLTGNLRVSLGGSGGGSVNQGTAGTNAQAWWMQIGDTVNGPAAITTSGADGVSNTLSGLQTYARTQCWNGATWDRCGQLTYGTAGAPSTQVTTVQGIASMTPFLVTQSANADPCSSSVNKTNLPISQNGTSSVQLIGVSGSTTVYVCSISLVAAGATTVAITTGTGTACVTGNAAVIGSTTANIANSMSFAANGGMTMGSGNGTVAKGAASSELCMINGTNVYVSGNLTYVQQ